MKILLINNKHHIVGGAHRVYFNTASILEEYGHDVFYFSMRDENMLPNKYANYFPAATDFKKISFSSKIRAINKFIHNREAFSSLINYIDVVKPDVAHIHLFLGGLTTSILQALKKRKVPVVLSVHDYRLICPAYLFIDGDNRICEKCKDQYYLRCTIKRCSEKNLQQSVMLTLDAYYRKVHVNPLNYIDSFIFVSRFSQDKHIDFNFSFKSKAKTLYNFIPDLKDIKSSISKGEYFLYYGRLSREKGLETLIEAALSACIKLKIVGTGPLSGYYENRNFKNIQFLGYKSGEELWKLVQNASFVIVPSICYENNPLTILEAYAYGKPVIGTRIGGIPEILLHEQTGFLFEPGDIVQLQNILIEANLLSFSRYKDLSENARKFAEFHFDPKLHYKQLISIYEGVIKCKTSVIP